MLRVYVYENGRLHSDPILMDGHGDAILIQDPYKRSIAQLSLNGEDLSVFVRTSAPKRLRSKYGLRRLLGVHA